MRIVSLKEDYAFKEFMSREVVRKYFLAAVLGMPVEEIRSVRLMNTFLSRRWRRQKQGILDVQVEFNDDTRINLEMQVAKHKNWEKRNLFYLSKMYTDDLHWGEDYGRLRRCISISILDFNLTEDACGHNVYRMRTKQGQDFSDMLELHIIELRKVFPPEDDLSDWVQLFNATTEEELDMIKSGNAGIQAGIKVMREMSLSKRIRLEIEAREKARRDRVAEMEYMLDEAREEGEMRGEQQAIISLLRDNVITMEEGAKRLHMSVEDLEALCQSQDMVTADNGR